MEVNSVETRNFFLNRCVYNVHKRAKKYYSCYILPFGTASKLVSFFFLHFFFWFFTQKQSFRTSLDESICTTKFSLTCFSAKWYWHSFFHNCLSSLSIYNVGVTCPKVMISHPSENLCKMLFSICKGRSLSVSPLLMCWKSKTLRLVVC